MNERLSQEGKMTAQFILAVVAVFAGLVLLFIGFFAPPYGAVDSSLLVAYGETLTFAGSLIGVDYHYKTKTTQHE